MRRSIPYVFAFLAFAAHANGQSLSHAPYRVEVHVEGGVMGSYFVRKESRALPQGASVWTLGYDGIVRVMWHPDHRLAVGFLTGYQLIVAEKYNVPDPQSDGNVSASLSTIPIMIDESMQAFGIEGGVALGGYIIRTHLDDQTVATATRFELGTIFHTGYHFALSNGLALGAEVLLNYMPYRGIVSIAPQLDLKYNLLTY